MDSKGIKENNYGERKETAEQECKSGTKIIERIENARIRKGRDERRAGIQIVGGDAAGEYDRDQAATGEKEGIELALVS